MPSKRKLSAPKSASKQAAKAVKPGAVSASPKAAVATKPERVAKPAAHIARTVATVTAQRTNFAEISDRDNAYFTTYKRLILANSGKLTVAEIVAKLGTKLPNYSGSAKAHDAGVIVRLTKAGLIAGNGSEASPLSLTTLGKARA